MLKKGDRLSARLTPDLERGERLSAHLTCGQPELAQIVYAADGSALHWLLQHWQSALTQ